MQTLVTRDRLSQSKTRHLSTLLLTQQPVIDRLLLLDFAVEQSEIYSQEDWSLLADIRALHWVYSEENCSILTDFRGHRSEIYTQTKLRGSRLVFTQEHLLGLTELRAPYLEVYFRKN